MPTGEAGLLSLPLDILLSILASLPARDVQAVSGSNVYLRAVCGDVWLWRGLFVRDFGAGGRLWVREGVVDWRGCYAERVRRERRVRVLRLGGWGWRSSSGGFGAGEVCRVGPPFMGNVFRMRWRGVGGGERFQETGDAWAFLTGGRRLGSAGDVEEEAVTAGDG